MYTRIGCDWEARKYARMAVDEYNQHLSGDCLVQGLGAAQSTSKLSLGEGPIARRIEEARRATKAAKLAAAAIGMNAPSEGQVTREDVNTPVSGYWAGIRWRTASAEPPVASRNNKSVASYEQSPLKQPVQIETGDVAGHNKAQTKGKKRTRDTVDDAVPPAAKRSRTEQEQGCHRVVKTARTAFRKAPVKPGPSVKQDEAVASVSDVAMSDVDQPVTRVSSKRGEKKLAGPPSIAQRVIKKTVQSSEDASTKKGVTQPVNRKPAGRGSKRAGEPGVAQPVKRGKNPTREVSVESSEQDKEEEDEDWVEDDGYYSKKKAQPKVDKRLIAGMR